MFVYSKGGKVIYTCALCNSYLCHRFSPMSFISGEKCSSLSSHRWPIFILLHIGLEILSVGMEFRLCRNLGAFSWAVFLRVLKMGWWYVQYIWVRIDP